MQMSQYLSFWGAIAGILGLFISALALFRDIFNFQLEWAASSNSLKRLAANRRFQVIIAIILISFAFWSLYNKIQSVETRIAKQEERITSAYITQTAQIANPATVDLEKTVQAAVVATQTALNENTQASRPTSKPPPTIDMPSTSEPTGTAILAELITPTNTTSLSPTSTDTSTPMQSAVSTSSPVPPTSTSKPILPTPTFTSQTVDVSPECVAPEGLIHLIDHTDPYWSAGIWASKNMLDFIKDRGEIDTNSIYFGEFKIWINPCPEYLELHGYTPGVSFWQDGQRYKIPLGGEEATTVTLPRNTGIWKLGIPY
jgi:hypothetical protein